MAGNFHKIGVIVFFLMVFAANGFPLNRQFTTYKISSGLAHNTVWCLIQDNDGYMWIGTRDGLSRFDGKNFKTFKHVFGDSTSIINNQISCLIQAKNNDIWVGTVGGLSKYNKQTKEFQSFNLAIDSLSVSTNYVRSILEIDNGELLIGTTSGLYIFNLETESYEFLLIEPEISSKANSIRTIFKERSGDILIGTNDGLFLFNRIKSVFNKLMLTVNQNDDPIIIRTIKQDKKGILWAGTERHGVLQLKYNQKNVELIHALNMDNAVLNSNSVRSIYFENDSLVWLGTFGGLNIYNTKTGFISYHTSTSVNAGAISHNSVHDITADSMGGVWVATYWGGLNYYNNKKNIITHYAWFYDNFQKNNSNIVSVVKEYDEELWIGTEGGGILQSTDLGATINTRINISNSNLPHNTIKSIEKGHDKLWVGTLSGLSCYDLKTKEIKNYFHDSHKKNSLFSGHVGAIYYENEEKIFLGSNASGVQVFNSVTHTFTTLADFMNANITCFFKDSNNRMWIGTEDGVLLYDLSENRLIDAPEILNEVRCINNFVSFIYEDSQKRIWIGTHGNGLYLFQNNKLFWYNTSNGLIDNTVNSLLEEKENSYWIATNKGLSKIELLYDAAIIAPKIKSYDYSTIQGLQALQFSPNCAYKTQSGKLIFGGINGLNVFKYSDIKENDFQPNLIFEELRIYNQVKNVQNDNTPLSYRLNDTERLTLKYNQRNFSISFVGINFINPDKNIYRYKIEDMDENWIELGNQEIINFNYFPSGTYELALQVSTTPESWDGTTRKLTITVLPPWWKTWWALVIYALFVNFLLLTFFNLAYRWGKMKNQLSMQQFKSQKEKELHQMKLKFYTDVSHELRTPLTLILAPLENIISKTELSYRFRTQLIQIQRSGYRLMQLVNQILDLRKLETGHERLEVAKGNVISFIAEICLAFREIAQPKNIDFEFKPHKNELIIWYDCNKLEIIINNLLSNAFKFTQQGGKIKLLLEEVPGSEAQMHADGIDKDKFYLKISILNEGKGISSAHIKDVFNRFYTEKENNVFNVSGSGVGLELTKRMVELHHGGISVQSEDIGAEKNLTVFSVYLSLDKDIYTTEEINTDFKSSEHPSLYKNDFIKNESFLFDEKDEVKPPHGKADGVLERLLVVEDNAEVRSFIKDFFADDYEVIEAENGQDAFEKAIDADPKLIISDVMMPIMDGIELCKKIKTDVRTSHIPVILLTARTAITFKYEGLETGADDYVTKPFSTRFLALRVKNLIDQRKLVHDYFKRQVICDPGTISLTSIDEKILSKAVAYITDNIGDTSMSVSKISNYVGMSRVHFYRKIKALTNQTAVEFIRDIRLKRAALLLEQNKLTIKEIHNMVGFEDADYFRDCFKGKYGVTPSEYSSRHLKA